MARVLFPFFSFWVLIPDICNHNLLGNYLLGTYHVCIHTRPCSEMITIKTRKGGESDAIPQMSIYLSHKHFYFLSRCLWPDGKAQSTILAQSGYDTNVLYVQTHCFKPHEHVSSMTSVRSEWIFFFFLLGGMGRWGTGTKSRSMNSKN